MVSNLVVKILGLLCKVPLHNILHDQGMSYFNIAYSIFTTLYVVSTAGLPTAIAIMVSGTQNNAAKKKQTERIFRVALTLFFILGVLGTSVMLFFSKQLAAMMGSELSRLCIIAISPTLFFVCLSSAIRGYFQGNQHMLPIAISEVMEAIGKFAIGIVLGYYAISIGESIEIAAAYAIFGITIGVAVGMVFLIISKILYSTKDNSWELPTENTAQILSHKKILSQLLGIAAPITLSSLALNLTGIIDSFTIINCMKNFTSAAKAEIAYGNYSTLAVTMSHLPSAFITPIASSLTPALTAALVAYKSAQDEEEKLKKREAVFRVMHSCLKVAAIIAIPCAIGMSVLSEPILHLLFSNEESVKQAAPLLSILSIAVFFTAMLTITTSILQSHRLQYKPIISMGCGILVKILMNNILIRDPDIGVYGAPIGTLAAYFVMAFINFCFVIKYVGIRPTFIKNFGKPLVSAIASSFVTIAVYEMINRAGYPNVATLISITATAIVYFILLLVFRTFTEQDIKILPKGDQIYQKLNKMNLIK